MTLVKVLPFPNVKTFYGEYVATSLGKDLEEEIAKLTTFRLAYKRISQKGKVCRMMTGKGNFSTCGLCNAASRILSNKHKDLSDEKRNLVLQYRS